ncbi:MULTISPECIES: CobD/CbiB family protein [Rubrivivax]|uniref:Cobalamin biosynthesis protein CobD n=1 Tax=Rubrivivax benzoatilyticus TaxID=316997 RepID=A0ABX0HQT9_9BURK|nr:MULTISPECIES: CobD/CbiB family protein [Rubrivivax]MCD0418098.1 CobD/CbiB family protein [Rubrivivax sp. JA1024]EGJ09753.1 putative cobalamin biosynthesis transmembrane protein [Rubrivivax benzoatilyticus JA2 = ATCC BAA-35]MCC9595837.1 CobD/CbiB family protein [Rubrivivax sp. JA1055]MCC9647823.1 CobD/CbiB family protein [Rubrivivax sp. JA1029]NHK97430.1 CobD/CbiB family protein [Rubrivivax benzoatilyticus]
MSFFAVLFALLIEQLKPLPKDNGIHHALVGWVRWASRNFDAGRPHHTVVVWCVAVLGPTLAVAVAYMAIWHFSLVLALVFDIALLYLTLGFRQFSHYFTDIRDALDRGDENFARQRLAEWRHLDASELPRTEVLRHVIEHALLAAHRHVFGVFFWFILLSALGLGPTGAVLYRMAEFASRYWAYRHRTLEAPTSESLMNLSRRWFELLDHVPARMTAFGFAVVGNFEEAVGGWRRDAALWLHPNEGIILAAAAGAVGVQLGGSAAPGVTPDRSKTFAAGTEPGTVAAEGSTPGAPPQLGHLQSVVGLVWRSVVLWMLLLALLTLANVVG